jgi:hypothetical protein
VVGDFCLPEVFQISLTPKASEDKFQLYHVRETLFTETLSSSLLPLLENLPPSNPEHLETAVEASSTFTHQIL